MARQLDRRRLRSDSRGDGCPWTDGFSLRSAAADACRTSVMGGSRRPSSPGCCLPAHLATTMPCSLIAAAGASCRSPHVLEAGLIRGRAGLLMALRALAPGDRVSAEHARRLRWGCTRVTDGSGAPRTVVLGRAGARAGLDLASGSAGVALALAPDPWAVVSDALALA